MNSELNGLKQQLQDLEAEKVALYDGGNAPTAEVERINGEIRSVQQQISELETQEIADSYQSTDKPCIIHVSGAEINVRDYVEGDDNYRVIAIAIDTKIHELNVAIAEQAQRFETERQQYREQIANADAAADTKYNDLYEQFQALKVEHQVTKVENEELRSERHTFKSERDDFERKWQAATGEIESLKQERDSKADIAKPTNLDGNLAEAMRKAHEAKPRIYNKRPGDLKGSFFLANMLETDEEITIPWMKERQYREATKEEVLQFRQEREAAEQAAKEAMESIPDDSEVVNVTEEDFRPEDQATVEVPVLQTTTDGLDQGNTDGEASSETFEEEVRRRLDRIESTLYTPTVARDDYEDVA